MKNKFINNFAFLSVITALLVPQHQSNACSRVMYDDGNGNVITARSMDWFENIPANLWVFPRGIERDGLCGQNSLKWKSKYGSLQTSSYNFTTADGMNEKGLVANMLWLSDSKYPPFDPNGKQKGIAISVWVTYVLDNFASVQEVVEAHLQEEFVVVSMNIPNTKMFASLHLCVSDPSGDNAVFEYVNGKLVIHHDKEYKVMTNEPVYEEQLAINAYWKNISGNVMLPGTHNPADRFVRGSYYINALEKVDNTRVAVASVFGVIRNVSVPIGVTSDKGPNVSATRWRTVADQKNRVYYFENTLNPNVVWVDFQNLDFSERSPIKKLKLDENEIYAGETSMNFAPSEPMIFLKAD
jgi:penicillin V acylase-like amidase (Ntn superfamily)